ncbi:hypothetical protein HOA59_02950 [archaeon]|jgi:hypothetical protein|nr:hypothetical protein [archaeon]MBT6824369.1 hypothetical protein [archaeon]MBT7106919.1 hypothetical protein [archaeon]MBT7297472.1 hypothetical protein [archaeon]
MKKTINNLLIGAGLTGMLSFSEPIKAQELYTECLAKEVAEYTLNEGNQLSGGNYYSEFYDNGKHYIIRLRDSGEFGEIDREDILNIRVRKKTHNMKYGAGVKFDISIEDFVDHGVDALQPCQGGDSYKIKKLICKIGSERSIIEDRRIPKNQKTPEQRYEKVLEEIYKQIEE